MANRNRDAGRERFWRAMLKRQATSGLSVREFCRQEKLTESNFYAWRRTIAERDQREVPARANRQSANRNGKAGPQEPMPTFVPVAVHGGSGHDGRIVLELGGGRRLRFAESIEPDRLAAFVRALEAEASS